MSRTRRTARGATRSRSGGGPCLVLRFLLLTALLLGGLSVSAAEAPTGEECLACHADKDLRRGTPARGKAASVFVDAAVLGQSAHAGLECVACHTTATAPHEERLPPVNCAACHADARDALAQGAHRRQPGAPGRGAPTCTTCHGTHGVRPASTLSVEACATCHRPEVARYRESVHGRERARGGTEAPTCRSCHGAAHGVLPRTDARAPTYHLTLPRTCAQCHADPELARRHNIPVGNVYALYMDSIHGRAVSRSGLLVSANCSSCHGAHEIKPPSDPTSRIYRTNVPATCGACHAGVLREYATSVHGQAVAAGNPAAPVCIDCHSAHQIRRVETEAWKLDIVRECGTCHAESLRTYRDTFHGQVTALGFTRVARCSDCHAAHAVRRVSDPASSVSPANRVATCRKCHPGATENFARYDPHADPDDPARDPWLHRASRFMRWLLIGTFSFFGVHTAAWGVRSLVAGRRRPAAEGRDASRDEDGGG